jgi:tRNA A37 threonylcarbamoyltransferase TsaD
VVAQPRLNLDNAAMIARAGWFHLRHGEQSSHFLDADPSLPWPGLERGPATAPTP